MTDKEAQLSKSLYLSGLQCLKRLYLDLNGKKGSIRSGSDQFILHQGRLVGEFARLSFPDGVMIEREGSTRASRIQKTRALISNPSIPAIFEAAFEWHGVLAEVDVLRRLPGDSGWELIEVKSATEVKPENLKDVGLQLCVLRQSGLDVRSVKMLHVNPECRFPHLDEFFVETDVTYFAERHARKIPAAIAKFRDSLKSGCPDVDIGPQCFEPRQCEYWKACREQKGVRSPSVIDLPGIGDEAWKYYRLGNHSPEKLDLENFSGIQKRALLAYQTDRPFIDSLGIGQALAGWEWPLHFLDFETIGPAIPRFEGVAPYQPIPFQFSCHVQKKPGGKLYHHEYLHSDDSDPSSGLAEALISCVGPTGHVVAYYKSVEARCIETLANRVASRSSHLKKIRDRLVDPLPILRESVFHPDFLGSFSLKAVAPALCGKDYAYHDLEVSDGMAAQVAFDVMNTLDAADGKKSAIREELLKYCRQDTAALAAVVDWLHRAAAKSA